MSAILRWIGTHLLTAVFWVFVLSINYDGRTLFSYAHETIIQNDIVRALDEELEDLWVRVYETARITFAELSAPDDNEASY
ncbi:hypothetical protein [Pseudobacteriovorax antillogorgiicola]|uniref:Uncharacterized protein n=1 Tax=Pseudobacteriovorax antillogorgiicola TaxID=1513793 RepID=A0A1Y6B7T7_9BACT|nr:hypothetical protein [Pseudobacteriovorax antillogorgiicola]TCS59290.1 hypothetical protein EDD56_101197 [Pseudobacteriovorax antillogorgiicola]SME89698.1 hypothetical protein SAMN06296036_101289 [Pseudobacteriovorax antillogorgiicola]